MKKHEKAIKLLDQLDAAGWDQVLFFAAHHFRQIDSVSASDLSAADLTADALSIAQKAWAQRQD